MTKIKPGDIFITPECVAPGDFVHVQSVSTVEKFGEPTVAMVGVAGPGHRRFAELDLAQVVAKVESGQWKRCDVVGLCAWRIAAAGVWAGAAMVKVNFVGSDAQERETLMSHPVYRAMARAALNIVDERIT